MGTAIIVVPLHHPLVVAEEIATHDLVSGGRLDAGLGRGYQQYEFERFGFELDTGRSRWDESMDIIFKALEGKPFTYVGKHFRLPETSVFPQPMQKPHPPVWIVAQSPYAVEAAVRRGFNVLTEPTTRRMFWKIAGTSFSKNPTMSRTISTRAETVLVL